MDDNYNIKPFYLLCYYKQNLFVEHINYVSKSLFPTFKEFLESLNFIQGNGIKLENYKNEEIGIIFKLFEEPLIILKLLIIV